MSSTITRLRRFPSRGTMWHITLFPPLPPIHSQELMERLAIRNRSCGGNALFPGGRMYGMESVSRYPAPPRHPFPTYFGGPRFSLAPLTAFRCVTAHAHSSIIPLSLGPGHHTKHQRNVCHHHRDALHPRQDGRRANEGARSCKGQHS